MITPNQFVKKFYPFALTVEKKTGIPAIAIMAQAAFESGWGKHALDFNFFGIKFLKGDFGYNKVLTTEYSNNSNAYKGENVKSVIYDAKLNKYKFKVYQYFAAYETPEKAFVAHSRLLLSKRYKHCLRWNYSPLRYLICVRCSGYATDPEYSNKMAAMIKSIKRRL